MRVVTVDSNLLNFLLHTQNLLGKIGMVIARQVANHKAGMHVESRLNWCGPKRDYYVGAVLDLTWEVFS